MTQSGSPRALFLLRQCQPGRHVVGEAGEEAEKVVAVLPGPVGQHLGEPAEQRGDIAVGELGVAHEAFIWSEPGRSAVVYAYEPSEPVHGFLTFVRDTPPFEAFRDPHAQRELVASQFPEQVWQVPRLVAAMRTSEDLFFDIVSQIHMPAWSHGRIALAGDAAHATSFLSGQGSSVALVGAYVLAGELATHADHAEAFAAYERRMRPFAERNQALATAGGTIVTPTTRAQVDARNALLRDPEAMAKELATAEAEARRTTHSSLTLPEYTPAP
ncbi:hypothetical protein SUDANB32_06186 [Streptomyces sp. enrichment culture]